MDTGRYLEGPPEQRRNDSIALANLQEMYGNPVRERTLGDYWRILLKRKWIVIVTTVVVFIVAALLTLRMTPIYEAMTTIMVSPPTSNPLDSKNPSAFPIYYQDLS